jgi:hypothetical protein
MKPMIEAGVLFCLLMQQLQAGLSIRFDQAHANAASQPSALIVPSVEGIGWLPIDRWIPTAPLWSESD